MSGNGDHAPGATADGGRLAGKSVLITGAGSGLGRESAAFEDISVDGFTSMLATNLTGVFLAARAAVPVMKQQRRGTILAVSSMAGFVAYPGR